MSRNYLLFLNDMRKACERIIRYVQGMSETEFLADEKTYDAVIRQMIIIGEANPAGSAYNSSFGRMEGNGSVPRPRHPSLFWH